MQELNLHLSKLEAAPKWLSQTYYSMILQGFASEFVAQKQVYQMLLSQ